MTEGWEFVEDATGRWRWRTNDPSGLPRESTETFKSGMDCVAHALRHGYLAGTAFSPLPKATARRPGGLNCGSTPN